MRRGARAGALAFALACAAPAARADGDLNPSSDVAATQRFVSAQGERAAVFGYPEGGLEVWAYPLQLLAHYQVRFQAEGRVEPYEGRSLLTRVDYRPTEVVRTYSGPDFVVRETLFAPRHEAGAIIHYEVEGRPDVRIEARFTPSLDLMWPGALGGQTLAWDDALKGYVEREPVNGFSGVIRSPQAVSHDSTINAATGRDAGAALVLQPQGDVHGVRRAALYIGADPPNAKTLTLASDLERREGALRQGAVGETEARLADQIEITTPDLAINRALRWSQIALDKAWACQDAIGCGIVAGYGPSRPGRRPQYAWFFAGDGLVAVEALLASGDYDRAKRELEFIARYQNKTNGMIWHEMSMSAPLIDWEKRYPYMFVHVDITYQYLATLADYVSTTGDVSYLKAHWAGVEAAWRYGRSLIDPATGQPHIPEGKQGQNEQDELKDDIRLSSAWISAADGFAKLARAAGKAPLARDAEAAAKRAREAVAQGGWDAERGFWRGGHTAKGVAIADERSDALGLVTQGIFSPAQAEQALDRLAAPDFQADWGVRSQSSASATYDPNAYSRGAVWGLGTSAAATTFWDAHRPLTAWAAWRGLAQWATADSGGRFHEVMAGDLFHREVESVPEQTWSSAGFFRSAVQGMLGLSVQAGSLRFAPHLPADWDRVGVRNVKVGGARLALHLSETSSELTLRVVNTGQPTAVEFAPELPLGARLVSATVNGAAASATLEAHPQDQHARLRFTAASGATTVVLRLAGGVRVGVEAQPLRLGDASSALKLTAAKWTADALQLSGFAADPAKASALLVTDAVPQTADADVVAEGPGRYRLTFRRPSSPLGHVPVAATIRFAASPATAASTLH